MSERKDIVERLNANDIANRRLATAATIAVMISGEDKPVPVIDAILAKHEARLLARIAALRSALRECADDLAGEINARCPPELRKGADAQRKYERDMEPVNRARALLEGKG